nr:hypothetical protein [Tanacetum cinerariifolium]
MRMKILHGRLNIRKSKGPEIIFDSIIDVFEKLSDDIQALVEITDRGAAFVQSAHGRIYKLVSLISMRNVFFIVFFNGGLKISIGDYCFFILFLLFLSDSIKEDSGHLPEIVDQLPFKHENEDLAW